MKIMSSSVKHNGLHPRLLEVLTIVYAKRPLIEYEVVETIGVENQGSKVNVWQNGQKIGSVNAVFARWSEANRMNEKWYAVESPNIRKERGRRNTKFSKDAKTAARTILEKFTVKPLADLGTGLISQVADRLRTMQQLVEYEYQNSLRFSPLSLVNYFTDLHLGKNPPMPPKIAEQIVSREVLRKRDNLDVANNVMAHCKSENGYAIKVMKDETLLFVKMGDCMTASKCQSTYELDQYTQEKLAMLKLLDVNQFAADIGVKFESDDGTTKEIIYFIVAGETVVH